MGPLRVAWRLFRRSFCDRTCEPERGCTLVPALTNSEKDSLMAIRGYPTAARVRQLLRYDPETGLFSWAERTGPYSPRWNARFAGKQAGYSTATGYIAIKLDGHNISAHRIAWVMMTGRWPNVVDHLNGNPSDNRWVNLRNVDMAANQRNQKRHRSNTSGRTGVSWDRFRGCWVAYIKVDGTQINLGGYDSFNSAVDARINAEKEYGFTGRQ